MLLMYCFSELTMSNNLLETESLAVKHRQFLITSKHLIDCIFCAAILFDRNSFDCYSVLCLIPVYDVDSM